MGDLKNYFLYFPTIFKFNYFFPSFIEIQLTSNHLLKLNSKGISSMKPSIIPPGRGDLSLSNPPENLLCLSAGIYHLCSSHVCLHRGWTSQGCGCVAHISGSQYLAPGLSTLCTYWPSWSTWVLAGSNAWGPLSFASEDSFSILTLLWQLYHLSVGKYIRTKSIACLPHEFTSAPYWLTFLLVMIHVSLPYHMSNHFWLDAGLCELHCWEFELCCLPLKITELCFSS